MNNAGITSLVMLEEATDNEINNFRAIMVIALIPLCNFQLVNIDVMFSTNINCCTSYFIVPSKSPVFVKSGH